MKFLKLSAATRNFGIGLSSMQFTLVLISLLIVLSVIGSCVPQISQDESLLFAGSNHSLSFWQGLGFTNVFGSWTFFLCVFGLFINLIACTVSRMPAKIRSRMKKEHFLDSSQVADLRQSTSFIMSCRTASVLEYLRGYMEALGYKVAIRGNCAVFEKGAAGWLAAPFTHLGLVILLAGVMISILFSYSGNLYLKEGDTDNISNALAQRGPLARVPDLSVKLLSTKSELYSSGQPKQWYSTLSITNTDKPISSGRLSVNSPLTVDGIDFCQSDWKIAAVALSCNNRTVTVPLVDMPHGKMGSLNLADDLVLICALDAGRHLNVYLKEQGSTVPRFLAALARGQAVPNLPVVIRYERELPQSGIKFKCDPGLWVTYTAFLFFFLGSIFVAVPNLKVWAAVEPLDGDATRCWLGFSGIKWAHIMHEHLRCVESGLKRQFLSGDFNRGTVTSYEQ